MGIQINGQTDTVTATDGSINIGGNVTVPGVLTYEDVTSVDAVGIVTAQAGIHVTGGSVGIGLTNPQNLLHIKSGTSGASSYDARYKLILENSGEQYIGFYNNDNSYSGIRFNNTTTILGNIDYYYTQNHLEFYSNGGHVFKTPQGGSNAERLRISSGGNIGIGTTNPSEQLHLSTSNANFALFKSSSTSNGNLTLDKTGSSGNPNIRFDVQSQPKIYLNVNRSNSDSFNIFTTVGGDNSRLTVLQGGNIGIGTDNPQAKLHINASGSTTSPIQIDTEYPTISPSLNLNFARSRALDPRITFTRASSATYVGRDGLIKTAGQDGARFDHDPVTHESLGLLIEESRTNYCGNSEMLANWSLPISDTFTASSGDQLSANPDGSSPAYHYVPSTTSGLHRYNRAVTLPTLDTDYVVSLFVKRVTAGSVSNLNRYVELETTGSWAANSPGTGHSGANGGTAVTFDLQDLAIQSKTDNTDGYTGGAKIEDYGNGWYRLSYVFNPGIGSQFTGQVWWGHPTTLGGDSSVSGNGNPSFYFWGASVENGKFITSHIPTPANSSVTRANDVASITGESFSSWFNNDEGTLVLTADIGDLSVANQSQVAIENTANPTGRFLAMGYRVGGNASGGVGAWYTDNGTTSAYFGIAAGVTSHSEWKQSFAYKLNDFAASVNGSTPVSDSTGGINTTPLDRMRFGIYVFGDTMDTGHIKSFSYYPKRLTDAQLQLLTS